MKIMNRTKVKGYTSKQLLNRMKSLPSFRYMPSGYHIIAVRSEEDTPDVYDDKLYLFFGRKFIMVMPCTTNSGTYGLHNFWKWNSKGTAIIKSNEVYYNAFIKTDGRNFKHHHGKVQALRQIAPLKYYRDNDYDNNIDEIGNIYEAIYNTNIHPNSYAYKTGIRSWLIGKWSTGCIVVNDLSKYWKMLNTIPYNYPVTLTLLKEW